jgi:hypothetical protein
LRCLTGPNPEIEPQAFSGALATRGRAPPRNEAAAPAGTDGGGNSERHGAPSTYHTAPDAATRAARLIAELRMAAALVRDCDWRGVRDRFEGHRLPPLAMLSGAAADALLVFPPDEIGPDHVLTLAWPAHREPVADLLGLFGVLQCE